MAVPVRMCPQGSALPGSASPAPRGAQLQVPACLSLLILELLHQRQNFGAGREDLTLQQCRQLPWPGGCGVQGWPERGQGHRHQLSPGHPHHQQQRVGRAAWDGMEPVGGQGRGAGDEGGWKGHSGGKLLVRERAGNF